MSPASRRIIIREQSKSISGSYGLYDLLQISTQSGSIAIDVTPHSASSDDPSAPARLQLSSRSGSIRLNLLEGFVEHQIGQNGHIPSDAPPPYSPVPGDGDDASHNARGIPDETLGSLTVTSGTPAREYITSVSSESGSVSGHFPLGLRTAIETRSGSMNGVELLVMPVNASGPRQLKTYSRDGSQSIRIVENDFWAASKDKWWKGMVSKHEGRSGSMNLEYPNSWEGKIQIETDSGSINVSGSGVQIIREEKGRVIAQKGEEDGGHISVYARSGSVNIRFG